MTKDEIKALIASKIAGQGTNIDAASVLPAILDGIIDLIPTLPEPYELPVATDEVLGGIKVGENLSITEEGVLSASGGGGGTDNAALILDLSNAAWPIAEELTYAQFDALFGDGMASFLHSNLSKFAILKGPDNCYGLNSYNHVGTTGIAQFGFALEGSPETVAYIYSIQDTGETIIIDSY